MKDIIRTKRNATGTDIKKYPGQPRLLKKKNNEDTGMKAFLIMFFIRVSRVNDLTLLIRNEVTFYLCQQFYSEHQQYR